MQVTILGTAYDVRAMGAVERLHWNLYLHNECLGTFYSDLYSRVEDLPAALQAVVFQKHSPPDRLDNTMPAYYKLASRPAAVRFLLDLLVSEFVEPPEVTEDNATEILVAVRHLIFGTQDPDLLDTEEKQDAALKTFENLERS